MNLLLKTFAVALLCTLICPALTAYECEPYIPESFADETENSGLSSKLSKALDDGPRSDQASLLIVFDGTGSMHADLNQLRGAALKIVNDLAEKESNPIYNYILSVFRDPDVEEPFVTRESSLLIDELNKINVNGGGDCPELALTGLRNALELALPNSIAFVFTDASAKDYDRFDEVRAIMNKKQIRVYFLTTGDCGAEHLPEFQVYGKIGRVSGGQMFMISTDSITSILLELAIILDSQFVTLASLDFEEAGSNVTTLVVDESFDELMISMSGKKALLKIRDSTGTVVSGTSKTKSSYSSDNIQIINFRVADTIYTIESSATSAYSIRVGGISDLTFRFGFSQNGATNPEDTQIQPRDGSKNVLSIFASNPSAVKCLTHVALMPVLESGIESEIMLKRVKNDVFITEAFDVPEEMFMIKILGSDSSNNPIDRIISTGIDRSKRSIKCDQECGVVYEGKIPHKKYCSKYYECVQGIGYLSVCPGIQTFNSATNECTDSASSICLAEYECV